MKVILELLYKVHRSNTKSSSSQINTVAAPLKMGMQTNRKGLVFLKD